MALTKIGKEGITGISNASDATAITIDASENVGIGVVPEAWNSSYDVLQISSGASLAGSTTNKSRMFLNANTYINTSNAQSYIATDEASQYWQNGGTHIFNVAGSGSANSTISWTTGMTIESSGAISRNGAFSTSNTVDDFHWNTGAGSRFKFHSGITGSRNILGFSNPNGQVGTIETNGSSTTYATSSDYRLKENVDYTWDATTRLKQLKPARFNFIADDTNTLVDGFLAHEVSSIVPEAINGAKDAMTTEVLYVEGDELPDGKSIGDVKEASVPDYQGIDQSKLVPLLVKTIQELEARLTAGGL